MVAGTVFCLVCKGNLTIACCVRYDKNVKEPCQNRHGGNALENRVEKLRKERGLNQEDFAKAIRVSRQTVSSIENGKYNPSLELAFAIADFFGKSIEEIFIYKGGAEDGKKLSE